MGVAMIGCETCGSESCDDACRRLRRAVASAGPVVVTRALPREVTSHITLHELQAAGDQHRAVTATILAAYKAHDNRLDALIISALVSGHDNRAIAEALGVRTAVVSLRAKSYGIAG